MKTLQKLMNCLESYIRKNFFNIPKTDISHECEKALGKRFFEGIENEEAAAEEYVASYKNTTRWQTL